MIWDDPQAAQALQDLITKKIESLDKIRTDYLNQIASEKLSEADVDDLQCQIFAIDDRISNLTKSQDDINRLGDDQKHTYVLNNNVKLGDVTKMSNGKISINGDGAQLSIHEITHVRQSLDAGGLNFDKYTKKLQYTGPGVEIQANAELEAYQMQFSYQKNDFGTGNILYSPREITIQMIGNLKMADGTLIYPAIYNKYIKNK
jgi:hypothetical protein